MGVTNGVPTDVLMGVEQKLNQRRCPTCPGRLEEP